MGRMGNSENKDFAKCERPDRKSLFYSKCLIAPECIFIVALLIASCQNEIRCRHASFENTAARRSIGAERRPRNLFRLRRFQSHL